MPLDPDALQEYTTLVDEVDRHRRSRLRLFAVTTVAVVVILAATFVLGTLAPETMTARLVLIYIAHSVVAVALLITHRLTHRMDFTAGYVQAIVEPRVRGSVHGRHEGLGLAPRRRRFRSLESSKALGACYALLISAIVAAGIANGLYSSMWAIGLPLLALVGVLNANLLFMSEATDPRGRSAIRRAPSGG